MGEYKFTFAEIVPVNTGCVIRWSCEGIGFGQLHIERGNIDRECMDYGFIISLFKYLENQENTKEKEKPQEPYF